MPLEPIRIPAAIPAFVVVPHDWGHRIRKIDALQDVGTNGGVVLHLLELSRGQRTGLVQNVFGDCQLACVVQQCRRLKGLQLFVIAQAE